MTDIKTDEERAAMDRAGVVYRTDEWIAFQSGWETGRDWGYARSVAEYERQIGQLRRVIEGRQHLDLSLLQWLGDVVQKARGYEILTIEARTAAHDALAPAAPPQPPVAVDQASALPCDDCGGRGHAACNAMPADDGERYHLRE